MQNMFYKETSHKSFINKVYDLVGQPSCMYWILKKLKESWYNNNNNNNNNNNKW